MFSISYTQLLVKNFFNLFFAFFLQIFQIICLRKLIYNTMYFSKCQDVFSTFFNFSFYTFFSIIYGRKKTIWKLVSDSSHWPNGERGIWTLAPVTRPTPLAGAPLQPLEYFSSESYYIKPFYVCQLLFRIFLIFSLLAYIYIIYMPIFFILKI